VNEILLNGSVAKEDEGRLLTQCERILARLRQGSVTNDELIIKFGCRKYTSRINELRDAGYQIRATRLTGGLWRYELVVKAEQLKLL